MKTFILTLSLSLLSYLLQAQSIYGIELGQNKSKYDKILKDKGWIPGKQDKYTKEFLFPLYNKDSIKIYINSTPKSNLIFKVIVAIPYYDWKTLVNDYIRHRQILIDDYGEPYNEIAEFQYPYKLGDGNELEALLNQKCLCASLFVDKFDNEITMFLKSFELNKPYIVIMYENKKTSSLLKSE